VTSVQPGTPATNNELVQAFTDAYWQIRNAPGRLVPVPERIAAGIAAVRPRIEAETQQAIAAAILTLSCGCPNAADGDHAEDGTNPVCDMRAAAYSCALQIPNDPLDPATMYRESFDD
jgi:hypothetical protein